MFSDGLNQFHEGEKEAPFKCLVLRSAPDACLIPMEEVRGVIDSDGAGNLNTFPLEGLGLKGKGGMRSRLVVFARAPGGPYLRFSGDIGLEDVVAKDVLNLPSRPFADSVFSALVMHEGAVLGLMLNARRLMLNAHGPLLRGMLAV